LRAGRAFWFYSIFLFMPWSFVFALWETSDLHESSSGPVTTGKRP
jgi:hypothetical protein